MRSFILLISFFLIFGDVNAQNDASDFWAQWRGPLGTGAALRGNPPVHFGESQNLKWKVELPGKGHATPLVWGDNVIVLTAVPTSEKGTRDNSENADHPMTPQTTEYIHEFRVLMINRASGNIIWEKTVLRELPLEGIHELGSWASNSPCTDGKRIYAYFGSRGLFCLDFDGNILWQRDFGQSNKHMSFGEGDSPYLFGDRIFVLWDHQGECLLYSIDKNTGEDIWVAKRDEITSWSTPLVVEVNGKLQVITSATNQVRSYDYETGEVIWFCTGMTRNVIPSPVYDEGIVYLASGFRGSALMAIDVAKAKGDVTGSEAILWTYNQDTPYTPNVLLMDGKLYFLRVNNGFLSCLDAKTGNVVYAREKLEGVSTLFSSPTGVANRIYIASKGQVLVLKGGDNPEVLAVNEVDDDFHASPVVVGNDLIIRGFKSLYCFSE